MSVNIEKGEISQKLNFESCVEWTIENILSYTTVDERYHSPVFAVPGSKWHLVILPNGESGIGTVGWIGLYLVRKSDDSVLPISVNLDFGVKKTDGTSEVIIKDGSCIFDKKNVYGQGYPRFLQRSILLERKSELAPSGALTVTSTIRVKDVLGCTSRLIELSDDFKNMFVSKQDCDATLKVKNPQFLVHRSVLASRNAVFKTMFQADTKEKIIGKVDIDDCCPESFNDFLVFIYSGRFENSGDVSQLYKIAHKYCVESLKSACVQFMLSKLSVDNVFDILVLGLLYDEPELKSKSEKFVDEHFAEVIFTDNWSWFLREHFELGNQFIKNAWPKGPKKKQMENERGFQKKTC